MIRKNYDSGIELSDSHWWYVGRSKIIESVLNKYLVKNTSNHILEIGCGSGSNLKLLSQLGKLEAFELDQSSRSHAIKKKILMLSMVNYLMTFLSIKNMILFFY